MRLLAYDTETTDLPLFNEPSEDPRQPHIVQLAGILFDMGSREIINRLDVVIRPAGWIITPENAAIHGITQEMAQDVGVPEDLAVEMLMAMWDCCAVRVAHNEPFDARIVRIALKRFPEIGVDADGWKNAEAECTARLASPIVKCPPTEKMIKARRGGQFKTPNMQEAYEHFFGEEFQGAHSAYADAEACLKVYLAIKGDEMPAVLERPRPSATNKAPVADSSIPDVPANIF